MMVWTTQLIVLIAAGAVVPALAAEKVVIDVSGSPETIAKLSTLTEMKKDQYETTAAFEKRLCTATYKALGITADKRTITIGLQSGVHASSAKYNADKQAFRVQIAMGGNHFLAGHGYNDMYRWNPSFDPYKYVGLQIVNEYRAGGADYSGANAFGVSKQVKVISQTSSVLYFPSRVGYTNTTSAVMLPAKPDEARRIQSDIRVAMITQLQPPCFVSGRGREPPTIDYPTDVALSELDLVGSRNPEWVIYLDSTKEILKHGIYH
jgi:hypothetical protein